ncbi:hypothetical protein SVIOM74S_04454 [Streptomyces violarus]
MAETGRALYDDRSLVRMHGMRHTVFVFPTALTAVVHASTGLAVAARERAALLKDMAAAGAPDAAWLKEVEDAALAALARRGQATASELAQDKPRGRGKFLYTGGESATGAHTRARPGGGGGRGARGTRQAARRPAARRAARGAGGPSPSNPTRRRRRRRRWDCDSGRGGGGPRPSRIGGGEGAGR